MYFSLKKFKSWIFAFFLIFGNIFFANFVFASPLQSDLNKNNIPDSEESEVSVAENSILSAGEYHFNNLHIPDGVVLTLDGDPDSTDEFKGVKINAVNITVDSGGTISSNGGGNFLGPGSPETYSEFGSSYGGSGGSIGGATALPTYGSATRPLDLGSGTVSYRGGGAIWLSVSGNIKNDGIISSDGEREHTSGGSIYVETNNFLGSGSFTARGGGSGWPYLYQGGGGGRIAIYYKDSSFTGSAEAPAGVACFYGCNPAGEAGTVGLFNLTSNELKIISTWRFQKNDEPFNFSKIIFTNGAKIKSENETVINANELNLDEGSSFELADGQVLNIPNVSIGAQSSVTSAVGVKLNIDSLLLNDGSIFNFSGDETLAIDFLDIKGNSTLTVVPEKILSLTIPNINIEKGSLISASGKGYMDGPGAPSSESRAGAIYGGTGDDNTLPLAYGSATKPVDFGSGGTNYFRGGGSIRIIATENLVNNGAISADGNANSSGGSVYITAKHLDGEGVFSADGGGLYLGSSIYGPGGGGRVFVEYESSSFVGKARAGGGCGSYDGWSMTCAGSGTVGLLDVTNNNLYIDTSWRFQKNDSPLYFKNIFISNYAKVFSEKDADWGGDSIVIDGNSILTLSGEENIRATNLSLKGNSTITVLPEKILYLKISNIIIEQGSIITADGKGYISGPGSPDSLYAYEAGASYGGKGGGATAKSAYGSDTAPTDFGSGTEGNRGGGAIRLIADNILQNDGIVSASYTKERTSGGSIYATTNTLKGTGVFKAEGGSSSWPYGAIAGAGGRIAIYFETSSFTGTAIAKAGKYCVYGCNPAAEDGTVVMNALEPLCTINCFSNVLFLPGIMGSRLYENENNLDNELWLSMNDSDHSRLSLDSQGKSVNDIYTKNDTQDDSLVDETGIVDDVYSANIYQSFIGDLEKWKKDDKIIEDYAFIPYDWRLSLDNVITNGKVGINNNLSYTNSQDFSESFILKKLEELQKSSRNGKVTIITHSNGGLVAKALVQKLKDTNNPLYDKIDKIIFVAVPQVGTPEAMVNLLHGSAIAPFGLIMEADRSRQLAENMPSVYNLLPSAGYFNTVDPAFAVDKLISFEDKPFFFPQTSKYGIYVSNATEFKDYILGSDGREKPSFSDTVHPNIGNSTLYSQSQNVHQTLDNWQASPSTKIIQVAGWGEETLAGLDYKSYKVSENNTEYLSYKPRKVIDGDGTVVVPSALWMSENDPNVERWWVDLEEFNSQVVVNREHKDILEISNLRDFIQSKIKDEISFNDLDNIIVDNTSNLTLNGSRLHYTLHSPLTLGITDSQGRYTGQDPITKEIKEEIPDVRYERIGDVQFISAPTDTAYTLKLQGYEEGSFALDIDKQEGNTITEFTSFQGVPSSVGTIATMTISEVGNIADMSPLFIDEDGDGAIDKTMNVTLDGVSLYDAISPKTNSTPTGTLGANGWYVSDVLLDLSAEDENSGVENTFYSLDNGVWNTYIAPFSLSKEGETMVEYYSVDKAGNKEDVKKIIIKIDKTAPKATVSIDPISKDLKVDGNDSLGATTTTKDIDTYIVTDQAGHTTKLFFKKTFTSSRLISSKLTSVQYDNAPIIIIPSSSLIYLWQLASPFTLLSQTIIVSDTYGLEALYDKSKNKTTVFLKEKGKIIQTQQFTGLHIIKLTLDKGVVGYEI